MSTFVSDEPDLDVCAEEYMRARAAAGPSEVERLREDFVRAAMPLAGRLASRYCGRGEPAEDLEQVARIGLVKTVDRYDADRGSFTAFAVVTIRGELRRHFRDHTWSVHVPRRLQDLGLEVKRAADTLTTRFARPPTQAEIADYLDVDEADVLAARTSMAGYSSESLNRRISDADDTEVGDLLGALDPEMAAVEDRTTLENLLLRLPRRDRRMLALRFWGNLSQAEIAEQFGISQMQVSRLLSRALTWLRTAMLSDTVPPWPGEADDPGVRVLVTAAPGRVRTARVYGEVDRDNAGELRTRLLSALCAGRPSRLEVDLGGVPLLDAAGLRVLMAVRETATARGVPLRFTGVSPHLTRLIRATGLGALLG
ncbi:SigB/SigF/SigG family RNA polymerase sigma factor [Catenuloplanes atrovinosus]|uniref:RNA polymerase sigma-B factor n=1 Tax=Catenuloplanes atrovinosus TaxID=137266 RepID=A0AAE3YT88_9ACTN|nr:SigB/SigF/SigG family RNA polymerase sigma factor [Catenuloplanes atrovinosus]MDR7277461.1 RNA polymerase sigma-B factor [Catenuloplanes atrovinosus]